MTVEKSYMSGAKLLGIVFELALLFTSMLPDPNGVSTRVVVAVLLSVFSMSFSAEASLFDDGLLIRYSARQVWMRRVIKLAIASSVASMAISFVVLAVAHSFQWKDSVWGILCILFCLLAIPRLFAYGGDFAYSVNGISPEDRSVIADYVSDVTSKFDGR